MSTQPIVTGHEVLRYWRLVSIEGGPCTGTVWISIPHKGEQTVKAVDMILWADEKHSWGRLIKGMTAFIRNGVVEISKHMIEEKVRDDVLDQIDAVKVAILAAAAAVTWPDEEASHE
jgi:hypothetical protein